MHIQPFAAQLAVDGTTGLLARWVVAIRIGHTLHSKSSPLDEELYLTQLHTIGPWMAQRGGREADETATASSASIIDWTERNSLGECLPWDRHGTCVRFVAYDCPILLLAVTRFQYPRHWITLRRIVRRAKPVAINHRCYAEVQHQRPFIHIQPFAAQLAVDGTTGLLARWVVAIRIGHTLHSKSSPLEEELYLTQLHTIGPWMAQRGGREADETATASFSTIRNVYLRFHFSLSNKDMRLAIFW
jgi:hypothetical protein